MSDAFLAKPLLCQELIGREQETNAITLTLKLAMSGKPQLLLLGGEAGLGKTRLCRALTETCQAEGVLTLVGQALVQDQALPFGPFLDAFRRYYSTLARQGNSSTPPGLPYFLRLLPELAQLFPEAAPVALEIGGTPAQQQQHLFQSILNGLRAELHHQPLTLILEDLHWADETSLELLAFLARQLGLNQPNNSAEPLLLFATYRTEELPDTPTLSRLLVQLNNQRQLQEIRLNPLSNADHTRLINSILGQSVSTEYSSLLFSRDEGNPFFTEELLGAMVATGQLQQQNGRWVKQPGLVLSLPLSLKASITERVASLPASDQETLAYAATIGREFDFELLATLGSQSERELLATLRRAITLQLISEVTNPISPDTLENERYQFRHALTREAIYSDMLTRERRLRHRAVAEALVKQPDYSPERFDRLVAEHFSLAALSEQARPYALREAERARQLFAFGEERHYLQIALASLNETNPERLEVLHRLGQLSLAVMDVPAALEWLNKAKEGYRQAGMTRRGAMVLVDLTFTAWFFDPARHPILLDEQEEAARLTYADPESSAQDIDALSIYSNAAFGLAAADMHTRALEWVERSFIISEKIDNPLKYGSLQMSILARGLATVDGPAAGVESGLNDMRQVVAFALQYSLPDLVMLSYSVLFMALINLGKNERAEKIMQEITDYEQRAGMPPTSNLKGWQRYYSGDWETAIAELKMGIEYVPIPTVNALYRATLAHILLARHQLAEAEQLLKAADPVVAPLQFAYISTVLWGFARLHALSRRSAQAAEYYDRILQLWEKTSDRDTIIPILLDGVKFYADSGSPWKSNQWLNTLKKVYQETTNPIAKAALLEAEGIQAASEGATAEGINYLTQAVAGWQELKRPYYQAQAMLRLAGLILSQTSLAKSDRSRAEELLQFVGEIFRKLGITAGLDEVENVRHKSGLESQSKRRATLESARQPFKGLTHREVQVLVQLAAGLTNKEIAAALLITEGTVELHVNHILGKLGCDSRTQAAAYAIEQGWLKAQLPTS